MEKKKLKCKLKNNETMRKNSKDKKKQIIDAG